MRDTKNGRGFSATEDHGRLDKDGSEGWGYGHDVVSKQITFNLSIGLAMSY